MDKHEVYIDGNKITIKGNFIEEGLNKGIPKHKLADYGFDTDDEGNNIVDLVSSWDAPLEYVSRILVDGIVVFNMNDYSDVLHEVDGEFIEIIHIRQ